MAEFQMDKTAIEINDTINGAVVFNTATNLTEAQKAQVRQNIGASAVGSGLKIVAHYDTLEELEEAVPSPVAGEAYSVGESVPYSLYIWDANGNAWRDYGAIRAEDITARIIQNTVVPVSAWTQDATVFADYPYKADISISEVTGGDFPIVVFNPTDAIAGKFCPVAYAFDGSVEIFAKSIPATAMTVPAMTFIALGSSAESTKGITNASGGIPSGSIGTSALIDGAVTQAKIAENAVSTIYTTVLPITGWGDYTTYFKRNLNLQGILATDSPIVDMNTYAFPGGDYKAYLEEFSKVYRISAATNALTLYATEVPNIAVPIRVMCVRR